MLLSRWLLKIFLFIIAVELGDESKMDKARIYLILKTIGFYVLSWTWGIIMSLQFLFYEQVAKLKLVSSTDVSMQKCMKAIGEAFL